jgi:hypothetical protein
VSIGKSEGTAEQFRHSMLALIEFPNIIELPVEESFKLSFLLIVLLLRPPL